MVAETLRLVNSSARMQEVNCSGITEMKHSNLSGYELQMQRTRCGQRSQMQRTVTESEADFWEMRRGAVLYHNRWCFRRSCCDAVCTIIDGAKGVLVLTQCVPQ